MFTDKRKIANREQLTWGSLTESPERPVVRLKKAVDPSLPPGNKLVYGLDKQLSLWALVRAHFFKA